MDMLQLCNMIKLVICSELKLTIIILDCIPASKNVLIKDDIETSVNKQLLKL